jgi:hypothetical protein
VIDFTIFMSWFLVSQATDLSYIQIRTTVGQQLTLSNGPNRTGFMLLPDDVR